MKRPTAADFMRPEVEECVKNHIDSLHIERANLFLAGKYKLEEGEILVGLEDAIVLKNNKFDEEWVEKPDYEFACNHCECEMEDGMTWRWKGELYYCSDCASILFDQPKPLTAYEIRQKESQERERQEQARLEQERLKVPESERRRIREEREERERRYMREQQEEMDERQRERENEEAQRKKNAALWNILAKQESNKLKERERLREQELMEEADYVGRTLSREYYDVEDDQSPNQLPGSVEELYEYLDEQLTSQEVVSIVPEDAIKLDEAFIYCDTFEEAKEVLTQVTCEQNDVTQLLPDDSYNISQQYGRFWYVLRPVEGNPNKFGISVFASKDEVATKYLIRLLEECMYNIDYLLCPEDYQGDPYYGSEAEAHGQEVYPDNWGQIQDTCFVCRKVDYLRLMNAFRGQRVVCDKCYPTVKQCVECDTITQEKINPYNRLCFDCYFKKPEKVQMPLEEHLMVRRDIQHLRPQYFDVLVDYAALAEFTIFDAYRYKSKCHFYDCIQRISPSGWRADETLAFCSRRHMEYADELGCHCYNVYDGREYDDEYEEATCKICNSPHKANVDSRNALMSSGEGNNPIVSAICVFEEISMSNILFDSLVDLCEYFV